jgi:hypothetical protein
LQDFLARAWSGSDVGPAVKSVTRRTAPEDHPYLTPEMLRGDGLKGLPVSRNEMQLYICT